MLRLRTRRARRAAVPAALTCTLPPVRTVREAMLADIRPNLMTSATAAYVRLAAPGDALDIRHHLIKTARREMCHGCKRPTFVLPRDYKRPVTCTECCPQTVLDRFDHEAFNLTLLETGDFLSADLAMAELGCRPTLCERCFGRIYVLEGYCGPFRCNRSACLALVNA